MNCCAPEDVDGAVKTAARVTGKPVVVYPNSGEVDAEAQGLERAVDLHGRAGDRLAAGRGTAHRGVLPGGTGAIAGITRALAPVR